MSEPSAHETLVFAMGEFKAEFPTDRRYARNHMWAQPIGDRWRFGFTAYAVRLLQDVYFLDWNIDAPVVVRQGQEIGAIESKKAESDLFSPLAGELTEFNVDLLQDPSGINVDKYGRGWLFEMQGDGAPLMSPEEYVAHLEEVWVVTQRTIKGQLNE
ncbi:MAG TPA: glycine cleavage system protein H [Planctomycetaceae bacterium]|nr:glycine cleavage system protein H [Planctomycetaceae bacterium]HRE99357.1 glycine cleavage system protein H [Pirellulaceae bacterium]